MEERQTYAGARYVIYSKVTCHADQAVAMALAARVQGLVLDRESGEVLEPLVAGVVADAA